MPHRMDPRPASTQTLALGRWAESVQTTRDRLCAEQVIKRLWQKDARLWSDDPRVQASIHQRLGWLTIPQIMAQEAVEVSRFADALRREGFTRAFLLGMGGSSLFAEVCYRMFVAPGAGARADRSTTRSARDARDHGAMDLAVLDTTDPTAILRQRQCGSLHHALAVVSSKSGSTSEVSALSKYFYDAFKSVGAQPGAHCLAITDQGTSLEAQAVALQFRRVFVHGAATGADVGGRFSALTYFGLVPAALMGMDIERLLGRAIEMLAHCGPAGAASDNPALALGAALGTLVGSGVDKLTLLCAPSLASFGTWVEQLIAESTGKSGKGIVPVIGEEPREPSQYSQDRVFIELQLAAQMDERLDRQVRALTAAGRPVIRIHWNDRYDLGGEVVKWAAATAICGYLMDINPFDEPNVRESKDRTRELLDQHGREGRWALEVPAASDEYLSIHGADAGHAKGSTTQCLSALFSQWRSQDYVAILSFLPRAEALDEATQELRRRISDQLGCVTLLGFGPRYLHSTGQLFKGGPDRGLFMLLTAEEAADAPIPGEPFSFRVLKQAQALGDFQAMQQKGRRILHIHLRKDIELALGRLKDAIGDALGMSARS